MCDGGVRRSMANGAGKQDQAQKGTRQGDISMVRRNAEGHTDGRGWRVVRALGFAMIATLAVGATRAGAAEVAEVRVGTHDKSTRIVLELDQASGYRLETPEEGKPELLIHLDATSVARDVPSKSPVVRKVHVEPTANGSTVHVRLATSSVAVKELLLANPPRLVFDLTAEGPIPKATAEEEAADAAAAPSDEPVEVASAAPAPAKLEKPKVEEAAPAAPIVVAAADAPESEPAAEEVAPPSEARPSMPPAPVAPVEPMKPSAEPTPSPSNTANPVTREATSPPAPMSPPPASSSADARRKALSAKLQPEPASSGSLLSLATSPLGLGVIGAAVLLLGLIVVMRRRRGGEDEDPLYTVMSAEDAGAPMEAEIADEPAPVRAAPIWEPDAFEASEPTPKQGPRQLALGSRPAPEPAPEPEPEEIAPPDDSDSIFGSAPEPIAVAERAPVVEPVPVIAQPAAPASQETERRIAELERRIEQLAEARERLERQVAAQTEELRVQRAAIARTQRVVRSIAKTEDMATEPVPRAPSAS